MITFKDIRTAEMGTEFKATELMALVMRTEAADFGLDYGSVHVLYAGGGTFELFYFDKSYDVAPEDDRYELGIKYEYATLDEALKQIQIDRIVRHVEDF